MSLSKFTTPFACTFLFVLFNPAALWSATLNVPGDYATIQAAIAAAVNGDTVLVAPGSYNEEIDFLGKTITLRGSGGAAVTTLDGTGLSRSTVTVGPGSQDGTRLWGFTLTNGQGTDVPIPGTARYGLALLVEGSDLSVTGCTFLNNSLSTHSVGGGAYVTNGSEVYFWNCTFEGNSVTSAGGGIFASDQSRVFVTGGAFLNCICSFMSLAIPSRGGGIAVSSWSYARIDSVTFVGCTAVQGGAIFSRDAGFMHNHRVAVVMNCRFYENVAHDAGAAIYNETSDIGITNCTFAANNSIAPGSAVFGNGAVITNCISWYNNPSTSIAGTVTAITYSNIEGGAMGVGNIDAPPGFSGLYELGATSPCIDAGNSDADVDPGIAGTQFISSTDIAGEPRQQDHVNPDNGAGSAPIIDMGCFEAPGFGTAFSRGDANADGSFDIADPVRILNLLFLSGEELSCLRSADANDDSAVDIGDVIFSLNALFGSATLPSPGPTCGPDPTPDLVECEDSGCP